MDKEAIVLMLNSIKEKSLIGPKIGSGGPGDRIAFALEKKLMERTGSGNFVITQKGLDLLAGDIDWRSL